MAIWIFVLEFNIMHNPINESMKKGKHWKVK